MPDCPQSVSKYTYDDEILYTVEVTDIQCQVDQNCGYFNAMLTISGAKTYDKNSDYSSNCSIAYRIYNEDNIVVDSGTLYLNGLSQDGTFTVETSISSYDIEPGNYRLELLDKYY